jgi:hypothetical protein
VRELSRLPLIVDQSYHRGDVADPTLWPGDPPTVIAARIRTISVLAAMALVALAAAAHRHASHPHFAGREVRLLTSPVTSAGGRVVVDVPDLGILRDAPVVVHGEIDNRSDTSVDVAVRLDGFRQAGAGAGARSTGEFAFVLRGGSALAVTDGGRHRVELSGPPGQWQLASLVAANARATLGAGRVGALVPREVVPDAPGWLPTVAPLLALGLVASAWGLLFRGPRWRRAHLALGAAALMVLLVLVALPYATRWRLLLHPVAIWTLIAILFAPALCQLSARAGRGARWLWQYDSISSERWAMLVALCALVVTLPIFEVVRGSPEFFVARNTSWTTALGAAAILLIALPSALLAAERTLRWISPAAATAFFLLLIWILAAALVHPWLTRAEAAGPWTMAALAAFAGVAALLAVWRLPGFRGFLAILAPAAIVVPVLFFGRTEVRESLAGWTAPVRPSALERTPPIVFVVFDEFPLHSLLDEAGGIDAVRFPHLAALGREGTWYREATTVSSQTVWAVPAIASGRYPEAPGAVPTLRYYPGNLFTMLAGRYRMTVFGRFLQLCPQGACSRDLAGPADGPVALAADLAVVWLHIVSPAPLADALPPVVGDWRGFAAAGRFRTVDGRKVRNDRLSEFERFTDAITADTARLYFLHSLTPHMPFEYVPSGRRYEGVDYQGRRERNAGLFERVDPAYADAVHQRHLLQVGFVDTMIGRITGRLRALGIYDDALMVVTADHGASYREGMPRRAARGQNLAEILRVPLIVKLPGQRDGGPVDGIVESVDILPTIADVLGARLTFDVDGRSLQRKGPERAGRVFIDRSFERIRRRDVTDVLTTSPASISRRIARFGSGDPGSIYVVPGTADLIGMDVSGFRSNRRDVSATLENHAGFANVDPRAETLPLLVRGRLFERSKPTLAVAVNGRIVATTVPFEERSATWYSTMIPESALRAGRNEVALYLVERDRAGAVLTVVTLQ